MLDIWLGGWIAFGLFVVYCWQKIKRPPRLVKYIDKLSGPPTVPILGNLHNVAFLPKEDLMNLEIRHTNLYGRLYRTWFGNKAVIHVLKGEYVEALLNSSKHTRKGDFYELLYPWLGTGLLTSEGDKWFQHRKMITPTFHFKILDTFISIFNDNTQILVNIIKEKEKLKETFNIYPLVTRCALDIICESAMGTKINAQKKNDSPYVSAVYKVSDITATRHFKFWLRPDFIFYNLSIGKEYLENLKVLHSFTNKIINERIKSRNGEIEEEEAEPRVNDVGMKKKQAFLDLLLDANSSGAEKLTLTDLREEVDTFMFEGHDTTTTAICWSIMLLAQHPKIQEEVYEELKTILGEDVDKQPTMKDLNEMKYLERVIKEALRLYPSVPFIARTIDEDVQIGEYLIPEGTTAMIHIKQIHTDPEAFSTPDRFNPDHFLTENIVNRHPYAYIPFSAGPRNCIGQKFAILEEKTVLSSLVRNFKFKTEVVDKTPLFELVLRPSYGLDVMVELRR